MARAATDPIARVERASARLRNAELLWENALVAARDEGASLRDLADAAGTSHTRVRRVLDARRAGRVKRSPR